MELGIYKGRHISVKTTFYCASHILRFLFWGFFFFFLQIKVLWQPWIKQAYWHCFSHSIWSVPRFGNAHSVSSFFIVISFAMVICDHWCLLLLLWLFGVGPNRSHIRQWTERIKCECLDSSADSLIPYRSPPRPAPHSETQHYWR